MNLLLILRSEFVCLMALLLLLWYASIHGAYDNIKRYRALNLLAIGHVVFDIITVTAMNDPSAVSPAINRICHVLFYAFAILYCCVLLDFVIEMVFGEARSKRGKIITAGILALSLIAMMILPMEYLEGDGISYGTGPAVFAGFAFAALALLMALLLVMTYGDRFSEHDGRVLILSMLFLLLVIAIQIAVPEVLFTGAGLTLTTAGIFVGIIDPVSKFRHKAYYDTMTGLRNQNCYGDDIAYLRKELGGNAYAHGLIYVACDINGLKQVNDDLGHAAGDDYIRAAAKALNDSLESAYAIYRTGGDEFCAIYIDDPAEKVGEEVAKLRRAFGTGQEHDGIRSGTKTKYSFSIGCVAAKEGENILDTAKRADTVMMEEKRNYYRDNGIDRRRH